MASFMSPVAKINNLSIRKVSGRKVIKPEKIVPIYGGYLFLAGGSIYCMGERLSRSNGCYPLGYGDHNFIKAYMSALVRLGVITKADMETHCEANLREIKRSDVEYDYAEYKKFCKKLGLTPVSIKVKGK